MMRRVALALALTVALTASGSSAGFRSVLQVSVGGAPAAYSGPGDIVSGAHMFWGLRGYNAAFSGAVASVCDAATGLVCADATWAAGVLTLPLIGGVACNNVTNICQIQTLYDQIGGNNCGGASCNITQATASRRPALVIAGAANGCTTTAFPCAAFVRANTQCLVGASAYTQALPITILATANRTGSTTLLQAIVSFTSTTRLVGWTSATNTLRMLFSGGSPLNTLGSVSDSAWHSLQYVASDSVGAFGVDGTTTTANTGTTSPAAAPIVGAASAACSSSASFDGVMTEAGVWPAAFTAQNITDMSANVRGYWGF